MCDILLVPGLDHVATCPYCDYYSGGELTPHELISSTMSTPSSQVHGSGTGAPSQCRYHHGHIQTCVFITSNLELLPKTRTVVLIPSVRQHPVMRLCVNSRLSLHSLIVSR